MSVASIVKRDRNTKFYRAGEMIFAQGDASHSMFVLEEGRVEISIPTRVLEVVEADGVFGEMGLVNGKPRSATATAATDCTLVELNEGDFYFLVQHAPYFAIRVMQVLSERVRRNTET